VNASRAASRALHLAEPPAAYHRRPRIVADATVLAAVVFGEAEQPQAVALLRGRALAAPHLVDCEIANVALKKQRRERLTDDAVVDALEAYSAIDLERHHVDVRAVYALARRYSLTSYDAAYLWLADSLEAPLATFDTSLGHAAMEHLRQAGEAQP
jgi:predicted nucleic acid-binding protein